MRIISRRTLREFWETESAAERPLTAWFKLVSKSEWAGPQDVKDQFGNRVDFVGDNRIIFDVAGNKYRLVVHAVYEFKTLRIKFVGAHKQYDEIDPETV